MQAHKFVYNYKSRKIKDLPNKNFLLYYSRFRYDIENFSVFSVQVSVLVIYRNRIPSFFSVLFSVPIVTIISAWITLRIQFGFEVNNVLNRRLYCILYTIINDLTASSSLICRLTISRESNQIWDKKKYLLILWIVSI